MSESSCHCMKMQTSPLEKISENWQRDIYLVPFISHDQHCVEQYTIKEAGYFKISLKSCTSTPIA